MANDVNDFAPISLDKMIGQKNVISMVRVAVQAAKNDEKRLDHCMMLGAPGLGKSQLAAVIGETMEHGFIEVLGQSLDTSSLNALLLRAKDRQVVHIDEAHEISPSQQTALYLALDKKKVIVSTSKGPIALPIGDFTLLLSTTDEFGLLQPLRERMRVILRYSYYNENELAEIVKQRAKMLDWKIENKILPEIGKRSRGVPRLAIKLLGSAHRLCRSENETTIRLEHLQEACNLESIDSLGLEKTEKEYLQHLQRLGGAARLNVLSSMLGLPTRTVSDVTETYLLRCSLIAKNEMGLRVITQNGIDHISKGA